jgi:hypothetical protein
MAAAKAMNDAQPNDTLAAQEMNTAFNYLPNGDKIIVAPGQGGNFKASVTSADGQHSVFDVDRNQMQAFAQTTKGLFDTNIENPGIFKSLAATGAKQERAPDAGDMVKQNNITNKASFPGNQPGTKNEEQFTQPGGNVAPQTGGGTIGQIAPSGGRQEIDSPNGPASGQGNYNDAGVHQNGATSLPTPGERAANAPERDNGPAPHWNADQGRYEYNPQDVKASPGGTKGPVRVISGGVDPERAERIRNMNPAVARQNIATQNNETRRDIAGQNNQTRRDVAGQQIQSHQGIANQNNQTRLQIAADRARDLQSNTNNRIQAEQARTASGILRDTMKAGNSDLTTAVQKMRDAGIDDRLISSLVPRQNAPGLQAPQQPQAQQPQKQTITEGTTAINPKTGHRIVYSGGSWQEAQ